MKNKSLPILFAVFSAFPAILFGQDNEKLIKDYISQNKIREYKKSDLNNIIVDNVDPSKSLNGNVVKFLQTYNGLPVYSSVGTALIQDNKIVYYTDNFVKDYTASTSGTAAISKSTALQKIAEDLKNPDIANFTILEYLEKTQKKATSANQRLVYATDENGNLRLAYEYTLMEPKSPNYWNIVVDANNGNILLKNNLTLSCNFHHDAYSSDAEYTHADHFENTLAGPQNNIAQNNNIPLLLPDNASYNVFPLPIEAPTFGSRSIINNPWILSASPEGWHSDGTNHYTITRGNNVFAYEDSAGTALTAPDYLTGTPADGGATRNFDFPFNINETPLNNRNAAITNLFYLNNRIHDIFYKFGFTESARNFQQNNFGNGPVGGDDDSVYAEAQDGSGLNNANFSSGQDGYNGRMQMYLWSPVGRVFFYNAPSAAVTRTPGAGTAQFGNPLPMNGLTGDVALSSILDGCTALPASSLTNKIGLVERGTCSFAIKVKNLQDAGAKAAIVYNNVANGATIGNMAGNDPTITIPSVLINNAEGEYIKTQLAASTTVNVTLKGNMTPDGSFDNGIVTHEYGHGISNRMTGTGYNCLNSGVSKEQMGEGWSDFFALMLTNKAGDDATVARGTGTYAIGQPITGGGIRPAKYSTNLTVNGFTYGNTNGMEYNNGSAIVPDVHSIGFVWATMLWDLHWKYVEKYGYASDVLSATPNGSTKVLQLVTDALKLQGCNPSFIDGRNAILAAEMATTQGQDKCMIWGVFARRGLGVNASAGAKNNINDQVQDFNVPEACLLATNDVKADKNNNISIYPNPAKDEFYIKFPSNTLGKVSVELYDMSGKLVSSEDKISPDAKKAISTSNLVNGTYMVKIKGLGFEASSKVMVKK
ncbi:putative secreted protein (Por secretion system target) [Chryseobacterium sp. CBTAP 102]|uniref:T9SS-dependent M36 family metallopeptidase n=1 Tax=Chryseobacterium sp. CBTAP 102 TaxID=2135644 RepID=UPI000D9FBF75|nr:T9SS-dependent M36 family metallopeptidase [Chryseobacterium sp. CBTAP 102]PXW14927.1 putative secreted protein (Por secretion system target) [Chryseobacterium sp. CBTAP 102]